MEESIAERLREIDVSRPACWGLFINEAMGEKEYPSCPEKTEDRLACDICWENQLRKLADAIEAEQAELDKCIEVLESDKDAYIEAVADFACWQMQVANALDVSLAEVNNPEEVHANIMKALKERTKTEQNGVDVDALLKLAETLDSVSNFGERDPKWIFRQALCDWAASIRNAVKVATPSKSRELNVSKPMPPDADDEPCFLGDAVWHRGRKHLVVAVSHRGKVCIRDWETRDSGRGAVWVEAERVTHRKPDAQEALEADAAKDPCEYFNGRTPQKCADCKLHDGDPDFDFEVVFTDCRAAMNRDLLRRQRELMGGEQ